MLNRLEGLYLNILRVVIIVMATVLLVGTVIGAVVAGPMLLSSFGGDTHAARLVRGDDLESLTRTESPASGSPTGSDVSAEVIERAAGADGRLRDSASNIADYVRAKQGVAVVEEAVVGFLEDLAYSLPADLFDPYCDSVLQLTRDLVARPAASSALNVDQLIENHHSRFLDAAMDAQDQSSARAMEQAEQRSVAVLAATAAMAMFGLFLLMVFVFVLVKIERNLRLLPVALIRAGAAKNRPEGFRTP